MRVYRQNWWQDALSCCSLTVCEGISSTSAHRSTNCAFPHCMWGYINKSTEWWFFQGVPSLYVRVYRRTDGIHAGGRSSLTVCEGVSCLSPSVCSSLLFPHCMWGCIGVKGKPSLYYIVPSLYVRVYRLFTSSRACNNGSLTVCEGISSGIDFSSQFFKFPHCMWGYIAHVQISFYKFPVPSLYVRVYRARVNFMRVSGCSLIICEGVSPKSGA